MAELLERASAMEAVISSSPHSLPPVHRSLHQLLARATSLASRTPAPPHPLDAQTHRFLTSQGIEVNELEPRRVDLERPDQADWADADPFDDIDTFVARSREALLDLAVSGARSAAECSHDEMWRRAVEREWDREKPRLLDALRQHTSRDDHPAPQQAAAMPSFSVQSTIASSAQPGGRSLRSVRGQRYATVISGVLEQVGARGIAAAPPLIFVDKFTEVALSLRGDPAGDEMPSQQGARLKAGRSHTDG
ncbi:MAG: hypothetical protein SGPRY_009876 [Prymnesium sp.]